MDWSKLIAGGGNVLQNIFGEYTNPSDAAKPYFDQIPGMMEPYYNQARAGFDPYSQAGERELPGYESNLNELLKNPGGIMALLGRDYKSSPGFQFALKQALGAGQNASAAGGMLGTPQHEYQAMDTATNLASKDYQDYINNSMKLYGEGLQGQGGLVNTGLEAAAKKAGLTSEQVSNLLQSLMGQAKLAYEGANNENQRSSSLWSGLGSAASSFFS